MRSVPVQRTVVRGGSVLLPNGELVVRDILVEDGVITGVGSGLQADDVIDAAGAWVFPGLIDLHTHGIGFESVWGGKLEDYAALEAAKGTTAFYPTLFSPFEETVRLLRKYREETDELRSLPQVAGFRLESPYLAKTGAGVADDLAGISDEVTDALIEAGGGHIKIWDVSPELPGASEAIRKLSEQGVVCSLAHTRATIEQGRASVDAGARLVTHLFNVFEAPSVTEPGCQPAGLTDYFLIEDRVTCEIIGDGTHVPPLLVEKTFRCKPADGLVFVTDSNLGAGLPPGQYSLTASWGDVIVNGSNDGVRLVSNGGLAGSALTPIDSFRNVIQLFGKDVATASRVCSGNPARLMGLNKGEISVGKDADFLILNPDLVILYTIVGGQVLAMSDEQ